MNSFYFLLLFIPSLSHIHQSLLPETPSHPLSSLAFQPKTHNNLHASFTTPSQSYEDNNRARLRPCRSLIKRLLRRVSTNNVWTWRKRLSYIALHSITSMLSGSLLDQRRDYLKIERHYRQCILPLTNARDNRHSKRELVESNDDWDSDEDEEDDDADDNGSEVGEEVETSGGAESSFEQKVDNAIPDMQQPVYLLVGCFAVMFVLCLFGYFLRRWKQKSKKGNGMGNTTTDPYASPGSVNDGMDLAGVGNLDRGMRFFRVQDAHAANRVNQNVFTSVTGVTTFTEEPQECDSFQHELVRPASPQLRKTSSLADERKTSASTATSALSDGGPSSSSSEFSSSSPSVLDSSISSSGEYPAADELCIATADMSNPMKLAVSDRSEFSEKFVKPDALCDAPHIGNEGNQVNLIANTEKRTVYEPNGSASELGIADISVTSEVRTSAPKEAGRAGVPIPTDMPVRDSDVASLASLKQSAHAHPPRNFGLYAFQNEVSGGRSCPNSRRTSLSRTDESDTRPKSDVYDPLCPPFQYPTPNFHPSPAAFYALRNDSVRCFTLPKHNVSFGTISEGRTAGNAKHRTCIPDSMACVSPDAVLTKSDTYRNHPVTAEWLPEIRPVHHRANKRLSIYPYFSSPRSRSITLTVPFLDAESGGSADTGAALDCKIQIDGAEGTAEAKRTDSERREIRASMFRDIFFDQT